MALGVLNAMVPCLWLYLRYWWNEVDFSSARTTFDRLSLYNVESADPWSNTHLARWVESLSKSVTAHTYIPTRQFDNKGTRSTPVHACSSFWACYWAQSSESIQEDGCKQRTCHGQNVKTCQDFCYVGLWNLNSLCWFSKWLMRQNIYMFTKCTAEPVNKTTLDT